MTPRLLSEPQAWREIARRLATTDLERDGWLCNEADYLVGVDPAARRAMRARVQAHVLLCRGTATGFDSPSAYPRDDPADARQYRVYAALMFALEAEDDAASLSREPGR